MPTSKIAITMDEKLVAKIDSLVAGKVFPNRSKAIQQAVHEKITRLDKDRLARESAKLNITDEQNLAEEGMTMEADTWPEY